MPTRLELVPGHGPYGRATQWKDGTVFDLSAPILDFTIQDMLDDGFVARAKEVLGFWIEEVDMENLRRMQAGVLTFRLPDPYKTGESGTQQAWVIQGTNYASDAAVVKAIALIREPLDWLSDQLFKGADLFSGVRGMLLLRQLYLEDETWPGQLRLPLPSLNALLGRTEQNYLFEAIDYLGSRLDLEILRSIGDRAGERLSRVRRLHLTGKDVVDDDLLSLSGAERVEATRSFRHRCDRQRITALGKSYRTSPSYACRIRDYR